MVDATPSQTVRPKAKTAGITLRLLATAYDLIILFGLLFIAFAISTQIASIPSNHWLSQLLVTIIAYAYFAGFWSKGGATTGMRPWKLRVAMIDTGDHPSLANATVRFFAMGLTWLAFGVTFFQLMAYVATGNIDKLTFFVASIIPFISMLCMLLTPRKQPLHDLLAGTSMFKLQ
ncbi:MAG: hypothetical protein CO186_03455 [Zetaproteobacteria bacterium CG_4_9_14_3_um_filter_49_83]|nr:MAG: hypothetical protein AUJ56_00175 [Zetaproteobacteria bacterium CG1_02_49_23]PIQ32560.1 MAG: hypothetical protein COW62_07360 [Zetaproteobacteria bacterium CG17_big_fil_post_rev_8_21_14_2_50_50_13]PIV31150.1 MAG: hypothetical protein COS35_02995 [Zetaproteobacteria bacterium CG02_land_8_20_14_3_00_50_9]PIY56137.1 MAG: hypothetical protein COZ00_05850 [Zetaproteobacteria bacterium CG_4_10_14_0_8_um_filter_49_80]PJA35918.1 MAG: hypothetical protein CO186_03455 [Zetaproteobacteria bacterium